MGAQGRTGNWNNEEALARYRWNSYDRAMNMYGGFAGLVWILRPVRKPGLEGTMGGAALAGNPYQQPWKGRTWLVTGGRDLEHNTWLFQISLRGVSRLVYLLV